VLQIVTGMYFRDVELNETTHRAVLHTNVHVLSRNVVDLPVGQLHPSTDWDPMTTMTVSVTERLEAVRRDGEPELVIATGGKELVRDLAAVLSFALNATFDTDGDVVRRLVGGGDDDRGARPRDILRRTFDAGVLVTDANIDDLRLFMSQLLALRRPEYEKAIRAIRQVVRACNRAADDPSLAYTMLVAALESLSGSAPAAPPDWDTLDGRKRALIDDALRELPDDDAAVVHQAVLDAESLGAGRRLQAFVADHLSPSYYRGEASGATGPVRGTDLPRALRRAYGVRSRNVHVLEELPPEAWVFTGWDEYLRPAGGEGMLSLEGLSRLARHVIRGYVSRAPTGIDPAFDYRASLPGQLRMQLAAQYWLANADGYGQDAAATILEGFAEVLVDVLADREGAAIPDMRDALARIETVVPGRDQQTGTAELVAVYLLWHSVMAPEHHRPGADAFLARYRRLLDEPTMTGFVLHAFRADDPEPWPVDDLVALADQRLTQRRRGKGQPLPAVFDAALHASAALALAAGGDRDRALSAAARALEEQPGDDRLVAFEKALHDGDVPALNVRALVLGPEEQTREEPLAEPDDGPGTESL